MISVTLFKNHLDILNLESMTSQRHATGFQLRSYLQVVNVIKAFKNVYMLKSSQSHKLGVMVFIITYSTHPHELAKFPEFYSNLYIFKETRG